MEDLLIYHVTGRLPRGNKATGQTVAEQTAHAGSGQQRYIEGCPKPP